MKSKRFFWHRYVSRWLVLLALCSSQLMAEQSLVEKAKVLLEQGSAGQAYDVLQSGVSEYAGQPDFDYLLGQSAIDSGHPLEAIFALERVLDIKPDFAPARAELAKAYFLIGENRAAKVEFSQVKQSTLPPQSEKIIDSYLSAIDERILGGLASSSWYIEAGGGYDSNVNSASSTSQIAIPNGILRLQNPEADSAVGLFQAGGQFSHAIRQNINVYGNLDLNLNEAFDESDFSTQIVDGVIGLHFLQGINQYRLSVVGQLFALDGSANRKLLGLNGQWQRTIDAANQLTVFGQFASLRFPGADRLDVNQASMGTTWLHLFANSYQPMLYVTAYYGNEKEQTDIAGSDFIGRDYIGLRTGLRIKSSARLLWSAVLAYQQSEHGGKHPVFDKTRKDDFTNLALGVDYQLPAKWSVQPELSYSNNSSSLAFNSYDRVRAFVNVRKEF